MGIFVLGFALIIAIFLIWLSGLITSRIKSRGLRVSVRSVFIFSLLLVYFSTNIFDYYKFKEICDREAGLKVYRFLESDVGWTSSNIYSRSILYNYPEIAFVRYENEKHIAFDLVRTNEKKDRYDNGLRSYPSDGVRQPLYIYKKSVEEIPELKRTVLFEVSAIDIESGQVMAVHKNFTHKIFNFEWGPSSGTSCSSVLPSDLGSKLVFFEFKELQPAFYPTERGSK
ncbi:hypothetical protein [Comamonas odontotermitis]|uniref:hypothetical protein n=1 Tax=Comamonas odontotermitis TaxID=379895 RepID=UPI001CC54D23|nr:hypothetical protein [Comamonas odontotermitis]UBB16004.1 hypothetical protein LAD35_14325 [Comamonas odontotermitis]